MKNSSLLTICTCIFILTVITGAFYQWGEKGIDDAFITYRYAGHIAGGDGFVWNKGESPVYGSTSFLYTILLSTFNRFNFDIPQSSVLISIAARGISGVLIFLICMELSSPSMGAIASFFYAINPAAISYSAGLETQIYIMLILAGFYFYFREFLCLCALSCGLLVMTRIDGLLVPAMIFIYHLIKNREIPLKPLIAFSAILSPWVFFSLYTFGSLLPNSFYAKRLHEKAISGSFNLIHIIPEIKDTLGSYVVLVLLSLFALAGIFYFFKEKSEKFLLISCWGAGYYLAYTFAGLPDFPWYYMPLLFLFFISASQGMIFLANSNNKAFGKIAIILAIISVSQICYVGYKTGRHRFLLGNTIPLNDVRYRMSQEIIKRNINQDATILAYEVGMIGYYTGLRTIDMLGLVSPEVIPHIRERNYLWSFKKYNPDYVTLIDASDSPSTWELFNLIKNDNNYEEALKVRTQWGHNYILFSKKKEQG